MSKREKVRELFRIVEEEEKKRAQKLRERLRTEGISVTQDRAELILEIAKEVLEGE